MCIKYITEPKNVPAKIFNEVVSGYVVVMLQLSVLQWVLIVLTVALFYCFIVVLLLPRIKSSDLSIANRLLSLLFLHFLTTLHNVS